MFYGGLERTAPSARKNSQSALALPTAGSIVCNPYGPVFPEEADVVYLHCSQVFAYEQG